jgi:GrpB-like predicted nucleotidyltransferase (UPF0157 family)
MAMLDESVHLEPHDPGWKQAFHFEQRRLSNVLGVPAERIEHFGSTAVPGLLAKPIVDIMIGVAEFPPPEVWSDRLFRLGYEGLGEAGVSGRLYFRKRVPVAFNVHVVENNGPLWLGNLALRDYLSDTPAAAREYESAKRATIAAGATTLLAYSEGKRRVVEELLRKALEARAV